MGSLITIDLDKIREDIAKKRQEIQELEALERAVISYGRPSVAEESGLEDSKPEESGSSPQAAPFYWEPFTLAEAAAKMLKKAGRPMKTREIVEALQAENYPFKGANIHNSVFTALVRKPEVFEKEEAGLWSLIEK